VKSVVGVVVALVLASASGWATPVTFLVTVPQSPTPAAVFLAGSFQNWEPGDATWQLRPVGAGHWVLTSDFPAGTGLQFKFTQGSWLTVEKGPSGEEIANRLHVVTAVADTLRLSVPTWASGEPERRSDTITGQVQTITVPGFLDGRRVWVSLPAGYDKPPDRRYPVLYMFDGQNVFNEATSFVGEWRVDETLATLTAAGQVTPLIVVAVDNGGAARLAEYTPWADAGLTGSGRGRDHLQQWVQVLLPWINAHYRTLPGPTHTGLAGSSLGGLMSLYGGYRYPNVFGRVGAFSPTLSLPPGRLRAYGAQQAQGPGLVYLDMGTREEGNLTDRNHDGIDDHITALRLLSETLLGRGDLDSAHLLAVEDEGARHNEQAWARRFPAAVEFLFPAP